MKFKYEKCGYKAADSSDVWVFSAVAESEKTINEFIEELRLTFTEALLSLVTEVNSSQVYMWQLREDAIHPLPLKPWESFEVAIHLKDEGAVRFRLMYDCEEKKQEDKQ